MTIEFQSVISAQNERLKQAVKLRQRRARDKQERILIDGQQEIALALAAGVKLQEIFIDAGRLEDSDMTEWLQICTDHGADLLVLPTALMAKVAYGDRHDQCVATAAAPHRELDQLSLPPDALIAILEGVEKPGNVGAVVRSADAAGVDAVIVADGRTDLFNPNAIRASRGTVFTVPLCAASAQDVAHWLAAQSLQVAVARVDASQRYDRFDFRSGTAIVLGSEADGVSKIWQAAPYQGIKLPMTGHADSLNVSVTAAVLFYEARRQRTET